MTIGPAPKTETSPSRGPHPLLALGFRPFFLLAGLFAVASVPTWLLVFAGHARLPARLWPNGWHAHEMVFGFAAAVLAGFLLTAVRNWTNRPTPSGAPLAGLVGLWLLGRAAVLFVGPVPRALAAAIDLAFLPALAIAIGVPIVRARNWRNVGFLPLLSLLTAANALFHFGSPTQSALAVRAAVDVVLLVIIVVGGRVIPLFTGNALQVKARRSALLDWGSFATMALVAVLGLWPGAERVGAIAALVAASVNAARMIGWQPIATRKVPLLWVLHVGYAWLPLGLALRGLSFFLPAWSPTAALHALTVGAMATLILGMTSRVSLGHTGRPLVAPRPVAVAYVLLSLSAALRVFAPIVLPHAYRTELVLSGALWTAAFGVFTLVYLPILSAPRVDGKPG